MRPVLLHFDDAAPGPWRALAGLSGWGRLGVVALVLAAAQAVGLVLQWQHLGAAVAARHALIDARVQATTDRSRPPPAAPPAMPAQRRAWNDMVHRLNTPWPRLLAGLEAASRAEVALLAIEPLPDLHAVRLETEARTLEALLAHAQALRTTEPFHEVRLVRHDTQVRDGTAVVRLTIQAHLALRPDSRRTAGSERP